MKGRVENPLAWGYNESGRGYKLEHCSNKAGIFFSMLGVVFIREKVLLSFSKKKKKGLFQGG